MTEVEDFVFAKMESFLDFTLTVLFCEPCAFGPLINGRVVCSTAASKPAMVVYGFLGEGGSPCPTHTGV